MTPDEIQAMAKGLAEGQAVWYVLSACIGGGIAGLGAYLAEKGKNRATKEDIREMTQKVEEVKSVFNRQMEDLKAHHQLRMVAAERRMQAHQEAYTRWLKLHQACSGKKLAVEEVMECRNWFAANCIFLGLQSRVAFWDICEAGRIATALLASGRQDSDEYHRIWEKIGKVGNVFIQEVELPGLSRDAQRHVAGGAPPT